MKEKHKKFLLDSLNVLPSRLTSLDASRPWLCYWIAHSLNVLGLVRHEGVTLDEDGHQTLPLSVTVDETVDLSSVSDFLFDRLWNPVSGGFCGGIDHV